MKPEDIDSAEQEIDEGIRVLEEMASRGEIPEILVLQARTNTVTSKIIRNLGERLDLFDRRLAITERHLGLRSDPDAADERPD